MNTKEQVMGVLKKVGFQLEEVEGWGYNFSYEGRNFLYIPNDEDPRFLNICMPRVRYYEEGGDLLDYYKFISRLNATFKYVKAYDLQNTVWLFYEREVFDNEDLEQVVIRMILHLEADMAMALQMPVVEEKAEKPDGGEEAEAFVLEEEESVEEEESGEEEETEEAGKDAEEERLEKEDDNDKKKEED